MSAPTKAAGGRSPTTRRDGKQTLLLLRTLAEGGGTASIGAFPGDGTGDRVMVRNDDRGRLFDRLLVEALVADGTMDRADGRLILRPEGHARLRRGRAAEGPEAQPFADQHRTIVSRTVELPTGAQTVSLNLAESPLRRLATRKGSDGRAFLEPASVEAGERLRRDYEIGALRQRTTQSWDGAGRRGGKSAGAGGQAELMDAALDARRRLAAAHEALGPELGGVLTDICCELKGLEAIERERRWPPRSAKVVLRIALDMLARHYGTIAGAGRRSVGTRAWCPTPAGGLA